jgi:hypothetical protein
VRFPAIAILVLLTAASSFAQQRAWRQILDERLPYFGDHNWIVVADSAFSMRSAPGIETIVSSDSQVSTVQQVLYLLSKQVHVRPVINTDLELEHVAEQDAPGIGAYRQLLSGLFEKFLPESPARAFLHTNNIRSIDEAAKTYNVLIIKTDMALPYTAVFLELRAGYWSDEAEQRLRESIH